MGYTRIKQCGNWVELYKYEKNYVQGNKRNYSRNKRRKREVGRANSTLFARRASSIQRAKTRFFDIVKTNLSRAENPAFLTLTVAKEVDVSVAYVYLSDFWSRLTRKCGTEIAYIGVPEWQKSGRIHFHFLVWGLSDDVIRRERNTRNIQRQWARGFCDVRSTEKVTLGLAGYLAKYMSKALTDPRLNNRRAYTCSRNIYRPTTYGSNSIDDSLERLVIPVDKPPVYERNYDTMWLGECIYSRYILDYKLK
jgi:hypothetical protein